MTSHNITLVIDYCSLLSGILFGVVVGVYLFDKLICWIIDKYEDIFFK